MKDCQGSQNLRKIWTKIKNNREEELKMLLGELKSVAEKGELLERRQKAA